MTWYFISILLFACLIIECGAGISAVASWKHLDSHIGYNSGQKYPPNIDCQWTINSPKGKRVVIEFVSFHLESEPCQFDFVALHDGNSVEAPLIRQQCGGAFNKKKFYSSTNSMTIRFRTDRSIEKTGFRLIFKVIGKTQVATTQKTTLHPIYGRRRDYLVFDLEDN